jgi:hypothetical protein
LHEQILKQQADEKRRAERRARHMQDDLRYALKKLPEPFDVNLGYEDVRSVHITVRIILANRDLGCIAY